MQSWFGVDFLSMYRYQAKWFMWIILFMSLQYDLISQDHSLAFNKLQTSDGLSQSSVMAITQDKQGLIWIGTRDGLNRYDGRDFKVYYHRPGDSTSLISSDIFDLNVDSDGDLWVGTKNGLNKLNMSSLVIERFSEKSFPKSLTESTVLTIEERIPGEIWIGTSAGLVVLNKYDKTNRVESESWKLLQRFNAKQIRKIYKRSDRSMWIGTATGISRVLFDNNDELLGVEDFSIEGGESQEYFVQAVTEDQTGKVWIGTRRSGLLWLDDENQTFNSYKGVSSSGDKINSNIRDLFLDHDGNMWGATYNGLIRINGDAVSIFYHDPKDARALSKNTVKTVFADRGGTLWVGTYYGGINLWNAINKNFTNIGKEVDGSGLNYDVVSSIVENDKSIFFGTEGGGVSVMNRENGKFKYITRDNSNTRSDNVKSLLMDDQNDLLWIGTLNQGLLAWDLNKESFTRSLTDENGLLSNSVYCFDASGDSLFFIGNFGDGLTLYNRYSEQSIYFVHKASEFTSLLGNQVRTVKVDSKGNLWVGTQNGLSYLSVAGIRSGVYEFQHFYYELAGQSGVDVLALYEDRRGTIWVGTRENGLHYFDDGKLIPIELIKSSENYSNTIQAISDDELGNIWVSTNAGIISYNPETKVTKYLKESDGLISNEFNQNAVLKSHSGLLYFGGPDGVTAFNPQNILINDYSPEVIITGLSIYNEPILPKGQTHILENNISETDKIELDYDQAIFTLTFSLPNYINPDRNQYEYRLVGLDQKWKRTSLNQADFTIQQPGKYVFEVRGINSDGITNSQAKTLEIRVLPAPWRTWWAFLIYGGVMILTLILFMKIIQSRSALRLDLLAEHQRNKQQEELNKMKLQFFTNISHEFRTPLTLVLGSLEQIMTEYSGGNRVYKQLQVMQRSAGQLLKLINQLMDFRKIENKQATLEAGEGNIVKFVNEIFLSFKSMAKTGNYEYTFESKQPEIKAFYDRDKLERVFYNLLSNAFKFTPKEGVVKVVVSQNEDTVSVDVIDSGNGVNPEDRDQIFDRFFQSKTEYKLNETAKGTGIGLALSKGIVGLHKGRIELGEGVNKGSKFTVKLQLGSDHFDESQIIREFKDSENLSSYEGAILEVLPVSKEVNTDKLVVKEGLKTILVVEDNAQVRSLLVNFLLKSYNVLEAGNGAEGLDIAIDKVPDLVISDVMMPEIDGIEFCGRIKNHLKTSHIPVVLLTARTSLIFKYDGLESGADDYINKPFNFRELELKVANLINVVDKLKRKFSSSSNLAPSEIVTSSKDEELLTQAIDIVNQNIDNEFFDVSFFCKELGVSRTMLFTKVKAWTDLTPNDFIQTMRMKRACQLLEEGKSTVSQICFNVGYKSPKYFSKTFQKHYGMTPSEYASKFNAKIKTLDSETT